MRRRPAPGVNAPQQRQRTATRMNARCEGNQASWADLPVVVPAAKNRRRNCFVKIYADGTIRPATSFPDRATARVGNGDPVRRRIGGGYGTTSLDSRIARTNSHYDQNARNFPEPKAQARRLLQYTESSRTVLQSCASGACVDRRHERSSRGVGHAMSNRGGATRRRTRVGQCRSGQRVRGRLAMRGSCTSALATAVREAAAPKAPRACRVINRRHAPYIAL